MRLRSRWPLAGGFRVSIAAVLGLLAILALFAHVQWRWIDQLALAERERMRASAERAAFEVAADFDREIERVFRDFGMRPGSRDPGATIHEALARWQAEARVPEIVSGVFVARPGPATDVELARFDALTATIMPTAWPPELDPVRVRLEAESRMTPENRAEALAAHAVFSRRPAGEVVESVPALLIRTMPPMPPPLDSGSSAGFAAKRDAERRAVVVVRLDRNALATLLGRLVVRQLGQASDFDVEVSRVESPAEVVYRSGISFSPERRSRPDAQVVLFAAGAPPPPGRPRPETGVWRLLVSHHAGSLEAAVRATRTRHIALAGGVLALLAASIAVLFASAQRAQRIARREVELVAGITHELRTPLSAIRSAGQNLADGVVADPERVRQYGELVAREGRRLSRLVEQALAHTGVRAASRRETVSLVDVLDQAIASSLLAERSPDAPAHVDCDVPEGLPSARGDAAELRILLENLLANAAKYGGGSAVTVRARAEATGAGEKLVVTVADRGPGIDPEDLPHVFEPFYRGRGLASGAIPGSGLGLALVRKIAEAHGGSVRVESAPGAGASFTVELPAA